ncbi:MAG: hypothetical protein GC156_16155 [Actinomycetales bacterium]|nr:hypothetical protein [Actinomycetales bacterium]
MSASTTERRARLGGLLAVALLVATSAGSATVTSASAAPDPAQASHAEPVSPARLMRAEDPASWRDAAVTVSAATVQRRPSRAAARQALAVQQAAFTRFTTSSKATRDMRGVEKSLYRGRYYNASSETKRLCIVKRESEAHYDVVNPSHRYFGAYQVSRALAKGATWMMLKEHKKLMGASAAKKVLSRLRGKPMNTWPRYWQDAAFHTIMNYRGTLSGASHWAGGRWHC